jgi:hypothetical protein
MKKEERRREDREEEIESEETFSTLACTTFSRGDKANGTDTRVETCRYFRTEPKTELFAAAFHVRQKNMKINKSKKNFFHKRRARCQLTSSSSDTPIALMLDVSWY